jgi:hypothetical protein
MSYCLVWKCCSVTYWCVNVLLFDFYDYIMACKRVTVDSSAYIMVAKCVVVLYI